MAIFSRKDTQAEIENLTSQLSEKQGEVKELQEQFDTSEKLVTDLNDTVVTLNEKVRELGENKEALEIELKTANEAIASHAEELENFETKVDQRAIEVAASAGADPVTVTEEDEQTQESIINQYKSMSAGKERAAFRRKHLNILK